MLGGARLRTHPWPLVLPAVVAALLALALFILWSAVPEAHPVIVVLGFAAEAVLIVSLYLVQRRRHW